MALVLFVGLLCVALFTPTAVEERRHMLQCEYDTGIRTARISDR